MSSKSKTPIPPAAKRTIIIFELDYKGSPSSPWFAVDADRLQTKGTYEFLRRKIAKEELTMYEYGSEDEFMTYEFTREDYKNLKEAVERGIGEWWSPTDDVPKGARLQNFKLYPRALYVKTVEVEEITNE